MLYLFYSIKQKKKCNKKKFKRIPLVSSVAIRLLYQRFNRRICEIAKEYSKFAHRSISRHAKLHIPADCNDVVLDKGHDNQADQKNLWKGMKEV